MLAIPAETTSSTNHCHESFSTDLRKLPLFLSPVESLKGRLAHLDEITLVLDCHATIITRRVVLLPVSPVYESEMVEAEEVVR